MTDGGIRMNSSEEDPIDAAVLWDDGIDLGVLLDMDDGLHSPPAPPALSIAEIEKILLNDDVEPLAAGDCDDFFSGCFLLDSPLPSSTTTTAVSSDSHASPDIASIQPSQPPEEAEEEAAKDSSEPSPSLSPEEEGEGEDGGDDPLTKKRKRQMRNRDAAVRSRERKKVYVKDLEAKSKYFESECRRLGMVLQCVMAENHSLRLAMYNKQAAYSASTTRQESAVLFLESLLLGSLLWLVGVMGLLLLEAAVRWPGKSPGLESPRREAPSEALQHHRLVSYMMSKGCRGSRRKMRMMCAMPAVILLRS